MQRKLLRTIEQYSMLEQGDVVIAAVSGGADSVALLDLLCNLITLQLKVRACHLNHCLRGEESDRDEQLVRTMCAQYGIPLDVRRVEILPLARARKTSVEQTARDVRYAFFEELCEQHHAKLATAHTLSDTAETVVLNLARGTGMTGLCGIPHIRGRIVRPLLACTRAEIEEYCYTHGLCFMNDSSNQSDEYTRNYIRHHIMPSLLEVNGGALEAIGRMTELMRVDAHYLGEQAAQAAQECACEGGYDAARLWGLHPAVRGRVLLGILAEQELECSALRVEQLESILRKGRGTLLLGAGRSVRICLAGGVLKILHVELPQKSKPPRSYQKTHLNRRKIALDGGGTLTIALINCEDFKKFKNNGILGLNYTADYDKMKNDILVRTRQAGDRLRQPGRGCTKPLKKLLCELAIPEREQLCVVSDSAGVIFCEGVGIDERVAPDAQTEKLAVFTITEGKTL